MLTNNINITKVEFTDYTGHDSYCSDLINQVLKDSVPFRLQLISRYYNRYDPKILKLWNVYIKRLASNDDDDHPISLTDEGAIVSVCHTAIFEFIQNYSDIIVPKFS